MAKQKEKKQKDPKIKNDKKDNKSLTTKKEKKTNKFIEIIKKKWLIDGTKTTILVLIILAIFFGINYAMQKIDPTPIDLSQEQLFTLTDASKDKIKNIQKEVKLYFVEYSEDDTTLDLAKQYTKVNNKITAEAVKANDRQDLVQKYGIETGSTGIIVECGDKYKVLSSDELVTYDYSTYETISIAEEKLTSAIQSVVTDEVPKVYFVTGYSNMTLTSGLQYLSMYLENEINDVESVDLLTTGKVPDDCDTLVIVNPTEDFEDTTAQEIIDYINRGGNILWFQAATAQKLDLPNVNKVLEVYGINPFETGIIVETDTSKMIANYSDLIIPEVQYSDITRKIQNSEGVIFMDATKINVANSDKLEELKVEETPLLTSSEKSYFRTDFINTQNENEEDTQSYTVGALMTKTIKEANEETGEQAQTSKLAIYGECYFMSDLPLDSSSSTPIIQYRQNKDLVLNSIAYLVNREEDITVRKSTGTVTYTATETENRIILAIIFAVPVIIIIIGIIVWIKRRRRK